MKSQNTVSVDSRYHRALYLYRGFSGIDATSSDINLEELEAQAFVACDNLWCSPNGYLTNERPMAALGKEQSAISHARFYAGRQTAVAYAARMAGYTELRVLDRPLANKPRWPRKTTVASCIFNRKAVFVGGTDLAPEVFDGTAWHPLTSSDAQGASICCTVSNRLVLSGYARNGTEIIVSRVNREDVLESDEEPGETSVIKAIRLNIANMIGTADVVRGLASFESNKLAIFTNDQVLIYDAPVDYTQWKIVDGANINVGTVSHNTIAAIGDEVFFCSRAGVHALRRSSLNGSTVFTRPLSAKIEALYRRLVASVANPEDISACFDRDNGRYTIMFPVNAELTYRLSLDIAPRGAEQSESMGNWTLSRYAGLTCGDSLAGNTVFGSLAGLMLLGSEYADGARGLGEAVTPILWHGDFASPKQSHALMLVASGNGRVVVRAESETGRELSEVSFDVADQGVDRPVFGVPLTQQFERPFRHAYTGVRLRVRVEAGPGQVRIFAIGVRLREI